MLSKAKLGLERSLHDLLYGSALFFPLRESYQRIFARGKLAIRRQMRSFYAPYIRPGDVVFDVGAYLGTYSERFTELGARVIAVEPNPSVCTMLRRLARNRAIYVENCAVGDGPGRLKLHVCVEHPSLSTVTQEWRRTAQQSDRHGHPHWQQIEVDVVTLDQLAARHGIPAFVKIDVEGFDDRVIRGMSFRPRFLSFEFNAEVQHVARDCLQMLKGEYEFNYSCAMDKLVSDRWTNAEQLLVRIFDGKNYYGDVLARRL